MKQVRGVWWPDATVESQIRHAMRSVNNIEWAIERCSKHRTAVQAGGNIGLWPRRLSQDFDAVITFEPDAISRQCLVKNAPKNVLIFSQALGSEYSLCSIKHRSLGSHRVVEGEDVAVIPLDDLELSDVDLIAFDLEGYELNALLGAARTISRSWPIIQLEVRGDEEKYGHTEQDVQKFMADAGYREVSRQPGPDAVFER